jgi:hypothetical protein
MTYKPRWISFETLIQEIEFLKMKISYLATQIYFANDDRDNKIQDLESMANPYFDSGSPICTADQEGKEREWEL